MKKAIIIVLFVLVSAVFVSGVGIQLGNRKEDSISDKDEYIYEREQYIDSRNINSDYLTDINCVVFPDGKEQCTVCFEYDYNTHNGTHEAVDCIKVNGDTSKNKLNSIVTERIRHNIRKNDYPKQAFNYQGTKLLGERRI